MSEAVWRLFDRYPMPAIVTDVAGVVLQVNRAAQVSLGWRSELVGRHRDEVVRGPSLRTLGSGDAVRGEAEVQTSSGHWMRYEVEVRALGIGDAQLIELVRQRPTGAPPRRRSSLPPPPGQSLMFEMDTSPERFGMVCFSAPGSRVEVGDHCYSALFERDAPCAHCPAHDLAPGRPNTGVYHYGGYYYAVRTSWISATLTAVEAQRFDDVLVRELVGARLATLAAHAGLSQREQDVFELLVLGRSLVEISTVLGITTRTVRFHQANVLAKLGADSRLDLMRLLL